ncbi:Pex12 amino terminal region-domain-containing protein [Kockovaella imperatae]|uniref:RING-type E3 ubiquitin transferase (cysteine targeting) n=1 Tax=Kockovaella imperatae TaxID=4999 RepID=A0A1Y1UF12_9TREE|nr:Pex12 amino terminal region-domain-containing protein [Kockovaella imperatae]ORX36661.1 Pex12 amino terminal region-domain-containing protein [Kockovaella imperatae]
MSDRPGPADAGPPSVPFRRPLVPKVSQVDAEALDESLVDMLSERVERSLGTITSNLSFDLKPEINLALKLIIFKHGIWTSLSSPGSDMVNIRLSSAKHGRPSRRILLLYLLLSPPIFPTYLLTRFREYALSKQWPDLPRRDLRKRIWSLITKLEVASKAWELVGWIWFLIDPRYPSLLMRILKLQYTASSDHVARLVSYEFMNRQLVWSVFTEFLMYSIPLLPSVPPFLSPATLTSHISRFFHQPTGINYQSIPLLPASSKGRKKSRALTGVLAHLPRTICPVCHLRQTAIPVPLSDTQAGSDIPLPPLPISADPTVPQDILRITEDNDETVIFSPARSDCWGECAYCYYCIKGELVKHKMALDQEMAVIRDEKQREACKARKWSCLRCGGEVSRAWRVLSAVNGDSSVSIDADQERDPES